MSGIGRCPRQLYNQYVSGRDSLNGQNHWYCWLGYLFEAGVISLFTGDLIIKRLPDTRVLVANFDARFRGHVDYETNDGDLVEIKSVNWNKWQRIRKQGSPKAHWAQVQMYLKHGDWDRGFLVYVARDVPHREWFDIPIWVFEERPNQQQADRLDAKARRILAAVDAARPPTCECGFCR